MVTAVIEPFAFFSWDSLRAGWHLSWRLFLRIVPAVAVVVVAGLALGQVSSLLTALVFGLGFLAIGIWSLVLVPQLTSRWAQERYGQPLANHWQVWWGITWRSFAVSMVAAVIMAVPNVVAVSVQTAYRDSVLGALGGLVVFVLTVANFVVSILATGWAMSRVAAAQITEIAPVAPRFPAPLAEPVAPGSGEEPTPRTAVAPTAEPGEAKRQCPKCGLYETERGSVIGWYCKVCGWREARR
jgi:hypothetical protein